MRRSESGFTLVELAIVLVIIGLLVGGVLVGQDLIKSATINAVISQIDRVDAGASTFRDKYGGLPGDLLSTKATQFGLVAGTGAAGIGDGNGLVQNGATTANLQGFGSETNVFWIHLGANGSALIPDKAGDTTDGYTVSTTGAASSAAASAWLAATRLRDNAFLHIYALNGRNYYFLGGISAIAATTGIISPALAITPVEAFNIDSKKDDGNGKTGTVIATNDPTTNTVISAGTGTATTECFNATAGVYDTNPTYGATNLNCNLSIRPSGW
ncbi:MAG: prepilin-type N-terminal cleavage/methylation domain-containing protein [Alphaproteobacteria bacterium]